MTDRASSNKARTLISVPRWRITSSETTKVLLKQILVLLEELNWSRKAMTAVGIQARPAATSRPIQHGTTFVEVWVGPPHEVSLHVAHGPKQSEAIGALDIGNVGTLDGRDVAIIALNLKDEGVPQHRSFARVIQKENKRLDEGLCCPVRLGRLGRAQDSNLPAVLFASHLANPAAGALGHRGGFSAKASCSNGTSGMRGAVSRSS